MFDTVLVANRGEIAARIIGTLRRMGIESVAVYAEPDAEAPYVRLADRAAGIGPSRGYLDVDRIIEVALATGSKALHPGYGFLSENPALVRACVTAGITFIGPPAHVMEQMGDKIAAKQVAIAAGVPVVAGPNDGDMDDADLALAAHQVGMPVILKPSAGGGGKGMVIVRDASEIGDAISSARRVARSAFGDDRLLLERYVERPRHIEVQVLADAYGHVVHLGERECTLQRRHQKVIEEAPSIFLDAETREALCASAVRLAKAVDYVGAGTVEYVVPSGDPGAYAFLEMNTRLQVEHPVTEAVTGLDLVEWQVRIAAGEPLGFNQDEVRMGGHAVEARVYAEDPTQGFLPTGGDLLTWSTPDSVRVDTGVVSGSAIGSDFDPMLAKVIAHAATRDEALARLREALGETIALGVMTNLEFLRDLLDDADVVKGALDTGLIERFLLSWTPGSTDAGIRRLAALAARPRPAEGPFHLGDSWRLGQCAPFRVDVDGIEVEVEGSEALPEGVVSARGRDCVWLHAPGVGNRRLRVSQPIDRRLRAHADSGPTAAWLARSPMPGTVVSLPVTVGDRVSEGEAVVVVEAMKMEHALRAPAPGIVTDLRVGVGDQVRLDEVLVAVDHVEE